MSGFETRVTGKWILGGEHAVLRGSPALVFPLQSRALTLTHMPHDKDELTLECGGECGEELQLLFWGVLEKACDMKGLQRKQMSGRVLLRSSIPVGAGLGASAALCVALSHWFHSMGLVLNEEKYEFSRALENLFHGESSGVDIAVVLSGKGLSFVRNGQRKEFLCHWQPKWYLSYSGKRGVTIECVKKVKDLLAADAQTGERIDMDMRQAVDMAQMALSQNDERQGLLQLKDAIDLANSCFERWGLTEGKPQQHMKWLKEKGAIATKPTGSGDGGYVLSLWDKNPDRETLAELIPCF